MALKEMQNCYGELFRWIKDGLTLRASSVSYNKKASSHGQQHYPSTTGWQDGTRHHNIQPLPWLAEIEFWEEVFDLSTPTQQQICSAYEVFLPHLGNSSLLPAASVAKFTVAVLELRQCLVWQESWLLLLTSAPETVFCSSFGSQSLSHIPIVPIPQCRLLKPLSDKPSKLSTITIWTPAQSAGQKWMGLSRPSLHSQSKIKGEGKSWVQNKYTN